MEVLFTPDGRKGVVLERTSAMVKLRVSKLVHVYASNPVTGETSTGPKSVQEDLWFYESTLTSEPPEGRLG